jgi:aldehyde dehydrogenase (NAD+)
VTDSAAAVGPLIAESARRFANEAVDEMRANLLTGGKPPADARFQNGFFYEPTVLVNVPEASLAAREELFAPVLAAFTVRDLDEALALANRTPYGLSATLFTKDIKSALTYVHRIEAGLVRVNGDTTGVDPHAPFGGVKGSSSGTREQGRAAREFYTEIKTVQVNPG